MTGIIVGKLASRKFQIVVAMLITSVVLLGFGKLDSSDFVHLWEFIIGSYIVGNVWEKKRVNADG